MRTVVVTGAASFVGSNIIKSLLRDYSDSKIYGIVRPNSRSNVILEEFGNSISVLEIDMNDISALKRSIPHIDIFYLNAWRGTRGEDRNDYSLQESNYNDTMQAIDVAIEMGAKTIIGVGSQAEYGVSLNELTEDCEAKPNTAYGFFKLKACIDGAKKCKVNNVSFKWGRIFSAYGIGDYSKTLVMYCIEKMLADEEVNVSSCTQSWNYVNVKDAAYIFAKMIDPLIPSGIYNVASNDTRSLDKYVFEIKKTLKSSSHIVFRQIETQKEMVSLNPNIDKIKKYIGNYSFISFKEGIEEIALSLRHGVLK